MGKYDDLFTASAPPDTGKYSDLFDNPKDSGGGFLNGLKNVAGYGLTKLGQLADRLGPAEIRGAAEGIQNYEPAGSGSFHPGVLGAAAAGAWKGLIHAENVQSAETQFSRMGLSDKGTSAILMTPGFNMKTLAQGGQYGLKPEDASKYENNKMYPLQVDYDSPAKVAGTLQDALAPTIPIGTVIKVGGKAIDATAATTKLAATKAILSHYSPPRLAQYASKIRTFGDEAQAIQAVADKLKENDLLYAPGKANFNLQKTKSAIGKQIGSTIQEAKAKDIVINTQSVLDHYAATKNAVLQESGKGVGTYQDFVKDVLPEIQGMVNDLRPNELGEVAIDKGVSFRRSLQDMVKKWDNTKNAPLMQQVAKDLQHSMNQEILKSDKILGPKLAALNQKFSDLSNAEPLIATGYNKSLGATLAGKTGGVMQGAREIAKHPIDAAFSPVQSLMKLNPKIAEKIANNGNKIPGLQIPQVAQMAANPEDIAAIKAPFAPPVEPGSLPPRTPNYKRRPLE